MENIEHNPHITYRVYAAIFNGKKKTAEIMEYLHLETEYRAICASLAQLTMEGVIKCDRYGYTPTYLPTK